MAAIDCRGPGQYLFFLVVWCFCEHVPSWDVSDSRWQIRLKHQPPYSSKNTFLVRLYLKSYILGSKHLLRKYSIWSTIELGLFRTLPSLNLDHAAETSNSGTQVLWDLSLNWSETTLKQTCFRYKSVLPFWFHMFGSCFRVGCASFMFLPASASC